MKKIIIFLISFLLFIPFIFSAEDKFYNALVTNPEGCSVYTEAFGTIEEVSYLEYNSVINIYNIDNTRARLEGYDDYAFIYLKDVKRIDDLKEIGIEDDEQIKEVEKPTKTKTINNTSNIGDYILCIIGVVVIVFLIIYSKKIKKNETY